MAAEFTVYGRSDCIWCDRAKAHLQSASIEHTYIDLTLCPNARAKLIAKGHRTVPQIYRGDRHIGGFEQLIDFLEGRGR